MKKIIRPMCFAIVLLVVLATALNTAPVARAAAYYADIRVLLSLDSPKTLEFSIVGDYSLREDPDFVLSSGMTLTVAGGRPVLTCDSGTFTASTVTLVSADYAGTSCYVRLKNALYGVCTYLGNMTFDVSNGGLRAINTLPVERYLYGVVPYEMSNTFPVEALKAQAVCARGYAMANCSAYRLRAYDIVDTSADQVYHGYNSDYTRAFAAVDETAGQVLTYNGDIIQAYYSASNGGQTELTGNVWSGNLPYYIQQDDPYDLKNPSSPEQLSFIPSEFTAETIPLMDALVLQMLQAGADAAAGEAVTLLSTVRVKARDAVYDPPSLCYTKADAVLMLALPDGSTGQLTVTLSLDDLVYSEKDNPDGIFNTTRTKMRMRGAEQGVLEAEDGKSYGGWFLTNRRWGHGVGMSQRGAQQRATEGQSYTEILAFYYCGTQLCTVGSFESAPALTSGAYTVSADYLSGVAPGTTPAELLAGLSSAGGTLSVITSNGTLKTGGTVSTGDFVRTVYNDGASYFDLPVVVYGDTDGDGGVTESDVAALRRHQMNTGRLSGVYLIAADVNHDGAADSADVLLLIRCLQGDAVIEQ
jgi:SpoIID/LytB domain protein